MLPSLPARQRVMLKRVILGERRTVLPHPFPVPGDAWWRSPIQQVRKLNQVECTRDEAAHTRCRLFSGGCAANLQYTTAAPVSTVPPGVDNHIDCWRLCRASITCTHMSFHWYNVVCMLHEYSSDPGKGALGGEVISAPRDCPDGESLSERHLPWFCIVETKSK